MKFKLSLLIGIVATALAYGHQQLPAPIHEVKLIGGELSSKTRIKPEFYDYVWIAPYFMPKKHPIYRKLKDFLSKTRITHDLQSLKKAGFINPTTRTYSRLVVTKHPSFPGYIFKIYVDTEKYHKDVAEWNLLVKRCKGVEKIRNWIEANHCEHLFCTPQKWIVELPSRPKPLDKRFAKHFILVEEEMPLISHEENLQKWASEAINFEFLDKLYALVNGLGLVDCCKIDNIPFIEDGRIAFIDTQSYHRWPIRSFRLLDYLNEENRAYWQSLIDN